MGLRDSDLNLNAQDPCTLRGGSCRRSQKFARSDRRTLQDVGKSKFFNFENSILKNSNFLKKTFFQGHSKFGAKLSDRRHEGLTRLQLYYYREVSILSNPLIK
jgi:hypothetical protein